MKGSNRPSTVEPMHDTIVRYVVRYVVRYANYNDETIAPCRSFKDGGQDEMEKRKKGTTRVTLRAPGRRLRLSPPTPYSFEQQSTWATEKRQSSALRFCARIHSSVFLERMPTVATNRSSNPSSSRAEVKTTSRLSPPLW